MADVFKLIDVLVSINRGNFVDLDLALRKADVYAKWTGTLYDLLADSTICPGVKLEAAITCNRADAVQLQQFVLACIQAVCDIQHDDMLDLLKIVLTAQHNGHLSERESDRVQQFVYTRTSSIETAHKYDNTPVVHAWHVLNSYFKATPCVAAAAVVYNITAYMHAKHKYTTQRCYTVCVELMRQTLATPLPVVSRHWHTAMPLRIYDVP